MAGVRTTLSYLLPMDRGDYLARPAAPCAPRSAARGALLEPSSTVDRAVFTSESIENIPAGFRARETYVFSGSAEIEEIFEIAEPGKDFEIHSRTRLSRVR